MLDKNLEDLINFSLIEQENLDKAGTQRRFRVSPFVDQYIQMKMSRTMKQDYLNTVCTLIQTKVVEYKRDYAQKIALCRTHHDSHKVLTVLQDQIAPYES